MFGQRLRQHNRRTTARLVKLTILKKADHQKRYGICLSFSFNNLVRLLQYGPSELLVSRQTSLIGRKFCSYCTWSDSWAIPSSPQTVHEILQARKVSVHSRRVYMTILQQLDPMGFYKRLVSRSEDQLSVINFVTSSTNSNKTNRF